VYKKLSASGKIRTQTRAVIIFLFLLFSVYQYTVNRFARASRALRSPVRPMCQILDLP